MYYITICIAIAIYNNTLREDFIHIAQAYEAGILDSTNSRTICLLWSAVYIFKSGFIRKLVPLFHRKHNCKADRSANVHPELD